MNEATRLYHRIRAMVLRDINAALAGRNTAGGATATVVEGHSHDDRYPLESELDAHVAATGVSVHGLGSISTQSAAGVNITGGNIAGITDLAVADGGTGASTASGARTNLGLGTGDSPQFTAINLGHASDTTIARVSAGLISVEGVTVTLNTATQTLTNKTLTAPVIATIVNTGTLTLPTSTDTLVGRATTDTLTNKTYSGGTNSGTQAGDHTLSGAVTFSNATSPIIAAKLGPASGQQHTLPAVTSDTIALLAATQTLTNKTLTTPTIASFVNATHTHQNAAGGGTLDHGLALTGLGDDDHTQYLLATGARTGATSQAQTFTSGVIDSSLTASRLLASNGSKQLASVADLTSWIAGTSNRVTVTSDGDGSVTLSGPQDIHTAATPTFSRLTLSQTTGTAPLTVSSTTKVANLNADLLDDLNTSSNPGAAAAVLVSDASGRLNLAVLGVGGLPSGSDKFNVTGHATLDSADFDGAVTIDDDLTVVYGGYYPLYVNVNTATPNNSNVGIMTNTPDAQFALDVAGPIRGEVLVGPHAIQLEDAEMIVHFDGPRPYETDFSGFSTGHMGQVGTESGGVIYRPGKFGKAVQVAEATTNLFTNPSFETGVTSWNVTGTATFVQSSDWFYYGSYSGRFQSTNVQRIETDVTANTSAGTQYTYTCFVRGSGTVYLRFFDNVSGNQAGSNIALSDDWQRVVLTKTFGAGSTSRYVHIVSTGAIDCYVDAVQLEQKSYATPYCDGSLGSGHSWSGTAHASTSSRTQAKAHWDIEYHAPFTAMGWFSYADALRAEASGGDRVHFGLYSGSNYIWVYLNDGDQPFAVTNVETRTINNTTDGLTWAAGTWHHWAFTLDASGNATLYIDGVEDGNATTFATMSGWTFDRLYLSTALASGHVYNGLTDDVALVGKVLSANEIRAIYESNAPVFAESSVFSFRAPTRSPVWVDEEGLWMRSYSGNATLGIYGGEATKSWGGLTLYDSDLAIGNSTAGYVHWHSGVDSDDTTYYGSPALEISIAGDAILLDKDGISVEAATSVNDDLNAYTFRDSGGVTQSGIWAVATAGDTAVQYGTAQIAGKTSSVFVTSVAGSGYGADLFLQATGVSESSISLYALTGNRSINIATTTLTLDATAVKLKNTGLRLADTNASHDLIIAPGSDLTANRTLTLMTGDADRTLTLTGNAILNQDTSTTGTPTWAQVNVDNLTLQEVSSTPSSPASGTEGRMYIKGDKLIIVFNDGGTVRYKYLDLTGTGVTWVHTTTAP